MRDVGEELRFRGGRLLERQRLTAQQLVLVREFRGRLADFTSSCADASRSLRVQPLALDASRVWSCSTRDDAGELARAGHHRARDRFDRDRASGLRFRDHEPLAPALLDAARPALQHEPRDNDENCATLAWTRRCDCLLPDSPAVKNRSAGELVIRMSPAGSVTMIGSPTGVDEQIEAVALGSCLRLCLHQDGDSCPRAPAGARPRSVTFRRTETTADVSRSSDMRDVSSSNSRSRAVLGIDEDHFAAPRAASLHQPSRERRREEQVVDLDGAASALALSPARIAKSCSARKLPDARLAGLVGEQDRVGDRVDDAVEQVRSRSKPGSA